MKIRNRGLLVSIGILLLVVIVIIFLSGQEPELEKQASQHLPPVSIVAVTPGDNKGVIHAYAEIKPRWSTTVTALVSGEVTEVLGNAFAGQRVKAGDLLLRVEDSVYRANLYDAELALSEAELNLEMQINKAEQAKRDWQRSGVSEEPSALVLNLPQLDIARKNKKAAHGRLLAARKKMAQTQIKAPFSGFIVRRNISVGQTINEGDALLDITHDLNPEVEVSLSKQQWVKLSQDWGQQQASIRNLSGIEIAQARIRSGGGFLQQDTRQYALFLDVIEAPESQVLSGDFVQVHLPARVAYESLAIPESALTRENTVWYLDGEDRLREFVANVLFHTDSKIVIQTPDKETLGMDYPPSWRIVATPLASFLSGMRVKPTQPLNASR